MDIDVESPFVPKRAKLVRHADDAADEFLDVDFPELGVFNVDAKENRYFKLLISLHEDLFNTSIKNRALQTDKNPLVFHLSLD